jgi:hypothetical protein
MNTTQLKCGHFRKTFALAALVMACACDWALGQGTLTFRFEGQAPGTESQIGVYSEAGMQVGNLGPQSLYLSGGGIPGYPDNGTGYLEIPAGSIRLGYNTFPPGAAVPFSLLSFDAATYHTFPGSSLTVVGYVYPQSMGSTLTVTNTFSISGPTFQTFHLDSSFSSVYQVDVLSATWSLDNLVISVPEPSFFSLWLASVILFARLRRK